MSWLDKKKFRSLLRPIYLRFGILRIVRQKYLRWHISVSSKLHVLWNSVDNLPALQELSNRRFNRDALLSAIAVARPDEYPEIDISVVSYNSSRWIKAFFASLLGQNYPLVKIHFFVVDNESQDDTVSQIELLLAEVRSRFASVRIIQQKNLGFGAGHDRAFMCGTSEYCLVTNLDLEFLPNSLCDVVRVALSDDAGVVASWELRQIPYEHPKYYDPVTLETHWSSHACTLIRRSAYVKVGGYDPHIFMYAEDVELSYRFRSYGYVLKYVPCATVSHFTYGIAGQIKPLQFSGSSIGNLYIRFRYGNMLDRFSGAVFYCARFFLPSPFVGAKSLLLKSAWSFCFHLPHFLSGKGDRPAYYPLRGFDYEMTRDGAFYEVQVSAIDVEPVLVTIITRTYKGRGVFLEQAMQSVLNQTYGAIELLVVEDGGESLQELVASVAERAPSGCKIRFLSNPKLGRSAAGNAGLAAAAGSFLMFLDDDDLLFSDHVETLVMKLLLDETLSAAYSLSIEVQTKIDSAMDSYVEETFHTPSLFRQEWDYEVLLDHNFIPIQAILFKRELYERHGGFDPALEQLEDWNLWLRYGHGNRFVYIPKTTSLFRSPADQDVRSLRHGLLHQAYDEAKYRAAASLATLNT
ncbi:Glycosyltransferase [Oxalobacteraceae bacterium IMCC9480]|nr:Glycosyltransferase [Oxalobacteraceae bacterium IMCC9480]